MPISLPFASVGSGLILLVIVAAWLAVLVPMALRSHDSSTSLSSVDRFSDAMRVLSRRDAAARARASEVAGPARLGALDADLDDDAPLDDLADPYDGEPGRGELLMARMGPALGGVRERLRAGTPAARRRRLLGGLVLLAVVTLVAGLTGPGALLVVHALADVALVLFVLQLRRLQVRRAAQARRSAPARRPVRRPLPERSSVRVTPAPVAPRVEQQLFDRVAFEAAEPQVFDQEAGQEVVHEVVAAAAQHADDASPSSPGLGQPWSPVPVPPPVYVGAPVAPSRRTADLSHPGPSTDQAQYEHLLGTVDEAPDLDEVVERRRAVNEW